MNTPSSGNGAGLSPGAVAEPSFAERMRHSKALIPTIAVMGVTVMALAATLVVNRSGAQPGGSPAAPTAQVAPAKDGGGSKVAPAAAPRTPVVAQVAPRPAPVHKAVTCANCGTVESATAVERQGKVNGVAVGNTTVGLGTVAGGVLGGVLGHQVGNGKGQTAMTVLGAAGGAYAGNRVEENMKKVTVYQMRVRMSDGSMRTIEQPSAVAAGSHVMVEGDSMRLSSQ
jgi:outer membrane lipoprotein SlyB